MNLLIFRTGELEDPGWARLEGTRATHVQSVLGAEEGQSLRVGILSEGTGVGVVRATGKGWVKLSYSIDTPPKPVTPTDLILAIPRPIVLRRVLQHVAALGIRRLLLLRSRRVEKSYLQSSVLEEATVNEQLTLGLEQAGAVSLPEWRVADRFRPFVEDELSPWAGEGERWLLHPTASEALASQVVRPDDPVVLAVGPEGGWVPFEVDCLQSEGFRVVHMGPRAQRVEVAVIAALSNLGVLRVLGDV